MSIFRVEVDVAAASGQPDRFISAGRLLVDTGSELSWIGSDVLRSVGATVRKSRRFAMANGQEITRDVGYITLRVDGFETIDEVVFAEPGDLHILGVHTLEGFNAVVDPVQRCLVAAGPIITAPAA